MMILPYISRNCGNSAASPLWKMSGDKLVRACLVSTVYLNGMDGFVDVVGGVCLSRLAREITVMAVQGLK